MSVGRLSLPPMGPSTARHARRGNPRRRAETNWVPTWAGTLPVGTTCCYLRTSTDGQVLSQGSTPVVHSFDRPNLNTCPHAVHKLLNRVALQSPQQDLPSDA
jgi:hypothetical protein